MNRNREYNELLRALDETPPELEYTVTRAKARAAGRRQWLGWLSVPVGTLAAVSLAFVMLVNSNVAFAQTVAEVPLLNELAAAVDWSGSLSAAVEHNYVQVIGQSQTKNGITVTVDHVIVDQQQVNLFITTENQDEEFPYSWLRWNVLSEAGECSMLSYGEDENGALRRITIDFHDRSQVPETLTMAFSVWPFRDYEELDPLPQQESAANFVFTIRFDPTYTANGETFPIGQWVELNGQRIYVDSLEIYPTHARLKLQDDEANTLRLKDLYFYLEDELGNRYEIEGGLSGYNDPVTGFAFDQRVSSPWFSEGEHLTLYLAGAAWLDEDNRTVTVDLVHETAEGLPEGVTLEEVGRQSGGSRIKLSFRVPYLPSGAAFFLFNAACTDPEGGVHWNDSGSATTGQADTFQNSFYLNNYPYDSVILTLDYTQWEIFGQPIAVAIQ